MQTANPTDLNLTFTPPAIQGFDYAGLKAWATDIKAKYADVVVMEDQVIGTKAEMAELNRIKKQLDAARIAAVKKVSEPIRDFEARVKEVCAIFQDTYDFLGGQVKNYEERAREEKRAEVAFLIEAVTAEQGYPGLAIPIQDAWLAKSKPMKTVKAEVEALILAHIKAERDAAALEQARQDRAVAIEQQCATLAEHWGFTIPASRFLALHDLAIPLTDVTDKIMAAFNFQAESNARANVAPVPPTAPVAVPAAPPMPTVAQAGATQRGAAVERKSLALLIEYDPAREGEVNQALRHLATLCASFTRSTGGGVRK